MGVRKRAEKGRSSFRKMSCVPFRPTKSPSSRGFLHDMMIHVIDGTYELFRHYYGLRRLPSKGLPFGAVAGVLGTVIQMLEGGATHIGVATDHIIESFRNDLWPGYKTGLGIEP